MNRHEVNIYNFNSEMGVVAEKYLNGEAMWKTVKIGQYSGNSALHWTTMGLNS
jgi:hypothetical protein